MFAIALVSLTLGLDPGCQALIDAHMQSLDAIRSIDVRYTIAWLDKADEILAETYWARDGGRERVRRISNPNGPAIGENARSISDAVIVDDAVRWLQNWDPKNPVKLTPMNQGRVRAEIMPRTGINPAALSAAEQLLFEVDAVPRRTLSELARDATNASCKKEQDDGRDLWHLSFDLAAEGTTPPKKYEVYLDPAAGYLIRKLEVSMDLRMPDGKVVHDTRVHEVLEFKEFGNGVYVPMRIRNGNGKIWGTELVVKSAKVNEPIAPEMFEMDWPKFALIRHFPPINGVLKLEVWGDGKSLGTVAADGRVDLFEAELRKDPAIAADLGPLVASRPEPPISTMWKLSIAFCVLVAIMLALLFYRRFREQSA